MQLGVTLEFLKFNAKIRNQGRLLVSVKMESVPYTLSLPLIITKDDGQNT